MTTAALSSINRHFVSLPSCSICACLLGLFAAKAETKRNACALGIRENFHSLKETFAAQCWLGLCLEDLYDRSTYEFESRSFCVKSTHSIHFNICVRSRCSYRTDNLSPVMIRFAIPFAISNSYFVL